MKITMVFVLVLLSSIGFSQTKPVDFTAIDKRVLTIDDHSPAMLAMKLTAPYFTELEKVRAVFRWITEHIAYKVYTPSRKAIAKHSNYEEPDDDLPFIKPLNERVSLLVLKRKTAICDQYARLFKILCDYAGICSEIISGYARPNNRPGKRFATNHSWNAVQIDGKWFLLDVTWASGFISYDGKEFVKKFDEYYFLAPPHLFIQDHYPEDLQWTLLDKPPVLKEFANSPFKYSGFIKSRIVSVSPARGIIEAFIGDTVKIELETNFPVTDISVSDTYPFDAAVVSFTNPLQVNGRKISFHYVAASGQKDWLYVLCNDELVLRYKLNIKNGKQDFLSKAN